MVGDMDNLHEVLGQVEDGDVPQPQAIGEELYTAENRLRGALKRERIAASL